jgi:methylenetetrahydrofolate reductase (NADPH)
MSIEELVCDTRPISVSFEFFPAKNPEAEESLWQTIRRLSPLSPSFVSVTYGAGGSTRDRTRAMLRRMVNEISIRPAAHLTSVGHSRHEIEEIAGGYWDEGVRHIVALRGDMPDPAAPYCPHPQGFASTPELIGGIRRVAPFEISVSFYPEKHPDSPTMEHDLTLLKRKVDAGAARALGQFCFDTNAVTRFRDRAVASGIHVPIIPGLLPTTGFRSVQRMAARCGTSIPAWLVRAYEGLDDDPDSRCAVAAAIMAEQVHQLRARGFSQFHFYTLNQAHLTYAACRLMGLRPADEWRGPRAAPAGAAAMQGAGMEVRPRGVLASPAAR